MPATHNYLRTHTLAAPVLQVALSTEDAALRERAAAAASGRAAKTLVKEGPLRVTLVALRRGTALSEHAVAGAFSAQVLRGRARLSAAGETLSLQRGALATFDAGVPHTVEAISDCALLITFAMA